MEKNIWWKNQLRNKEDRAVIKLYNDENHFIESVIIPTDYYPLNGKHEIFTYENTTPMEDEAVLAIFDEVKFEVGRCYTNTANLCHKLREHGYDARPYAGWLFTSNSEFPVHHSWCMLGESLLDLSDGFTAMLSGANAEQFKTAKNLEEAMETMAEYHRAAIKQKNRDRCFIVGQSTPFLLYVGCECEPEQGRTIYRNLLAKYPHHKCEENCDSSGLNNTQKKIKEKLR